MNVRADQGEALWWFGNLAVIEGSAEWLLLAASAGLEEFVRAVAVPADLP